MYDELHRMVGGLGTKRDGERGAFHPCVINS